MSNSSSSSARNNQLSNNDVVFGRGAGARETEGNRRFLSVVQQFKGPYNSTRTHKEKNAIACQVLKRIKSQSPPGRFLEPADTHLDQLWQEVDENKAIGKIKQALREPGNASNTATSKQTAGLGQPAAAVVGGLASAGHRLQAQLVPATYVMPWSSGLSLYSDLRRQGRLAAVPSVAPSVSGGFPWSNALPLYSDPQLQYHLLARQAVSNAYAFPMYAMRPSAATLMRTPEAVSSCGPSQSGEHPLQELPMGDAAPCLSLGSPEVRSSSVSDGERSLKRDFADATTEEIKKNVHSRGKDRTPEHGISSQEAGPDVEAAQFLLSTLTESVGQAVTELQREEEETTEEQRAEAVADLFGSLCEIRQNRKRVRWTDQVLHSVDSLVQDMRRELETMPRYEKLAFSEACESGLRVEFTDRRLELFLRRENMNPERAARRFVTYWEERRKLFGPDKFILPMTLKGALRDDLECLKNGPMYQVPSVDATGRVIGGYRFSETFDRQSLLRVFWFYSELSAKHPNAAQGIVRLIDNEGFSIWDLDMTFVSTTSHLARTALPVFVRATHACRMSYVLNACAKSLIMAKDVDKNMRMRVVFHDCPPAQTADALKEYGIPKHVIPKEMGGTCDFATEHEKWLLQLTKLDRKDILESDEFIWWEL